ncbi:MAG: carboxypeptidase regulatory-like domain-containing protein [Acidobacteria bacterium]|nr:carboxypeptidase regulatory-like domain-containing protein [Acidobacteriota bacterium]
MRPILILATFTSAAIACSVPLCSGSSPEFGPSFAISVTHEGTAQAGVRVAITGPHNVNGETGPEGTFRVRDLPPGDYWLKVDRLGVEAANQCFHVAKSPALLAKRKLRFDWSTDSLDGKVRRLAGQLLEDGTSIAFTRVVAYHTKTGERRAMASDIAGLFMLDGLPPGTYLLVIDGRSGDCEFDETRLAIRLQPDAARETLTLARSKMRGGCSAPSSACCE